MTMQAVDGVVTVANLASKSNSSIRTVRFPCDPIMGYIHYTCDIPLPWYDHEAGVVPQASFNQIRNTSKPFTLPFIEQWIIYGNWC